MYREECIVTIRLVHSSYTSRGKRVREGKELKRADGRNEEEDPGAACAAFL
jgi:hypothetical protein